MITDAGEELLLSLLLRGLTLRLYSTANATATEFVECDFDGYESVSLNQSDWTIVNNGTGLTASHPKISFECAIPKRGGVEVCIGGYYLTRGTTAVACVPFKPAIECKTPGLHRIDVTPQFVSRDSTANQE